jgi:hypothetical protein
MPHNPGCVAPAWAAKEADTLVAWFPDLPLACDVCHAPNGTALVYGRFVRSAPGGDRVAVAAACVHHLPDAWRAAS